MLLKHEQIYTGVTILMALSKRGYIKKRMKFVFHEFCQCFICYVLSVLCESRKLVNVKSDSHEL